jgi:hypothetical protein
MIGDEKRLSRSLSNIFRAHPNPTLLFAALTAGSNPPRTEGFL